MNAELRAVIIANLLIGAVLLMLCGCATGQRSEVKGQRSEPPPVPPVRVVKHRAELTLAVITPRILHLEWDFNGWDATNTTSNLFVATLSTNK